jgi:hypothetical protein
MPNKIRDSLRGMVVYFLKGAGITIMGALIAFFCGSIFYCSPYLFLKRFE